ncbi:caffeic acid 3-O-methyltransferase-like [Impatiens glandulifera]|uniref:caffeic acid 3-O-methyltransferase-like n=1 Tax=Impatiens glandulifera TaxID=253017 RepID=UPI001FB15EE2|nr:caffeic acid 3-O-methyltransferase-like [Impatiens glandulifera]
MEMNGETSANSNPDEEFLRAMHLASDSILPMTLRAAIELDLFEIMAKSGQDAYLSAAQICSHLPTKNNPQAPYMLERMLQFLASSDILRCSDETETKRLYALSPICKYFVRNRDGFSLAPILVMIQDQVIINSWYHLKDAILNGGNPVEKAHGMGLFDYLAKDDRFSEVFHQAMCNLASFTMQRFLQVYKGFDSLHQVVVVDVGGGSGATLASVVSKYPTIKAINFDLPQVLSDAPSWPGVEHVGGDMFENVPKGDVIFMKYILHDWSDDRCLKLLKNCWSALPETGKVIMVESILPETPRNEIVSQGILRMDVSMMVLNHPGGKERTEKEYERLATGAGFADSRVVCNFHNLGVMEFYKL